MALACIYCISTKGLKGSEIDTLPQTDEQFAQHVEREHHIPVRRPTETEEGCMERFKRENPEAGAPKCKCPSCQAEHGDPRQVAVEAFRRGFGGQPPVGSSGTKGE